jgi:hypothetical protein
MAIRFIVLSIPHYFGISASDKGSQTRKRSAEVEGAAQEYQLMDQNGPVHSIYKELTGSTFIW